MQFKPHFESYKFLEKYPLLKDDTGNEFCLVLVEGRLKDEKDIIHLSQKFYVVLGMKQTVHGNKSVGYYDRAFYKEKTKDLYKGIINGFEIEEIADGYHFIFINETTEINKLLDGETDEAYKLRWEKINKDKGLKTKFLIKHKTEE